MSTENLTNWNKQELQTYLLIFCMNANYTETSEEILLIKRKSGYDTFAKMHKEFEKDNDYQSIQKIKKTMRRLGYDDNQKEQVFSEIREVFSADGEFDILERNLKMGLKRLLL